MTLTGLLMEGLGREANVHRHGYGHLPVTLAYTLPYSGYARQEG